MVGFRIRSIKDRINNSAKVFYPDKDLLISTYKRYFWRGPPRCQRLCRRWACWSGRASRPSSPGSWRSSTWLPPEGTQQILLINSFMEEIASKTGSKLSLESSVIKPTICFYCWILKFLLYNAWKLFKFVLPFLRPKFAPWICLSCTHSLSHSLHNSFQY